MAQTSDPIYRLHNEALILIPSQLRVHQGVDVFPTRMLCVQPNPRGLRCQHSEPDPSSGGLCLILLVLKSSILLNLQTPVDIVRLSPDR